ncbi:MAG: TolC family protein [Campylobacteraceae bacterium]|nr:TolC family protein [Campylobacteraceae bacterium]
MRSLLFLSLCASLVLALSSENSEALLSTLKKEQLDLKYKHNELSSDNLKLDWVSPIMGAWSWNKTKDSLHSDKEVGAFSVNLEQPIFKSGGIYFAMRYADANREFLKLNTQLEEQSLVRSAMSYILNYQKNSLQIKRTKLQIANAKIDIERKLEQFESGFVDSSDLDQAVLAKNNLEHSLLELQIAQKKIMRSFETLSDAKIETFRLPRFEMMSENIFLNSSLDIKKQTGEYERAKWLQKASTSQYLPTVSLNLAYYNKRDEFSKTKAVEKDGYHTYGLKISMPLYDVNRGRTLELKRIETIRSGLKLQDIRKEESKLYERVYEEVGFLQEKHKIALDNYMLYGELVNSSKELAIAGEKTQYDVETLENSRQTMFVDSQIYEIDAQLSLLDLYAKMQGEV